MDSDTIDCFTIIKISGCNLRWGGRGTRPGLLVSSRVLSFVTDFLRGTFPRNSEIYKWGGTAGPHVKRLTTHCSLFTIPRLKKELGKKEFKLVSIQEFINKLPHSFALPHSFLMPDACYTFPAPFSPPKYSLEWHPLGSSMRQTMPAGIRRPTQ